MASLIQKGVKLDISQMPCTQVLKMATNNGASALGMGNEIGSIEVGKKADIILVNLRSTRFAPVLLGEMSNLESNLVYAAHGDNVDTVLIDGNVVMKNRKMLTVDEEEVIEEATKALQSVKEKTFF
jgi:5-methylthioadenosine/S-adenosylhomocysteine deaminase